MRLQVSFFCALSALILCTFAQAHVLPFGFVRNPCYPLASNWTPQWASLIEYWKLDGTGSISNGATISAAVGTSGTANSTGMAYTTGKIGTAASFNGSGDYISMGSLTAVQNLGQFTISAWIRPSSTGARMTVSGTEMIFKVQVIETGNVQFDVGTDGSTWAANVDSSGTVNTNIWTHIAGVYDGTQAIVYVNGANQGSSAMSGTTSTAGSAFQISGYQGTNESFGGIIDEVAVWKKALTATEISTIYNNQYCNGP